jgi:hypothetical protein
MCTKHSPTLLPAGIPEPLSNMQPLFFQIKEEKHLVQSFVLTPYKALQIKACPTRLEICFTYMGAYLSYIYIYIYIYIYLFAHTHLYCEVVDETFPRSFAKWLLKSKNQLWGAFYHVAHFDFFVKIFFPRNPEFERIANFVHPEVRFARELIFIA